MWGNDDALERWFADIKIRRGQTDTSRMESVPDPSPTGMTGNTGHASLIGELRG